MGSENQSPLNELQLLDKQVDQVTELAGLKPIFARVDELAKAHSGDFDVQLAAAEVKHRVVTRGTVLKQWGQTMQNPVPVIADPPPPPARPPAPAPPPLPITPAPPLAAPAPPPAFQDSPVLADQPPPLPKAPERPPLPPASNAAGGSWKSALLLGVIAGVLIAAAVLAVLVKRARARRSVAAVAVRVVTNPGGAAIRVNGEAKCNSDCSLPLPPGEYQVTAFLDGYQPSASNVKVAPGQATSVEIKLEPQPQMLRILTDLPQGQVAFDDQPPADLQDGQFVINNVQPGKHTVKILSKVCRSLVPG